MSDTYCNLEQFCTVIISERVIADITVLSTDLSVCLSVSHLSGSLGVISPACKVSLALLKNNFSTKEGLKKGTLLFRNSTLQTQMGATDP